MLLDAFGQESCQSYNVRLAQVIGLNNAIYFDVLTGLFRKAIQTNAVINDEYFWVDREYVTSRTTFSVNDQLKFEETLTSMGIIILSEDKKYVKLCLNTVLNLIDGAQRDVIKDFDTVKKSANRGTKADWALRGIIKKINKNYPGNIQVALANWLTTISLKYGYVNSTLLEQAEAVVNNYVWSDIVKTEEI